MQLYYESKCLLRVVFLDASQQTGSPMTFSGEHDHIGARCHLPFAPHVESRLTGVQVQSESAELVTEKLHILYLRMPL